MGTVAPQVLFDHISDAEANRVPLVQGRSGCFSSAEEQEPVRLPSDALEASRHLGKKEIT